MAIYDKVVIAKKMTVTVNKYVNQANNKLARIIINWDRLKLLLDL